MRFPRRERRKYTVTRYLGDRCVWTDPTLHVLGPGCRGSAVNNSPVFDSDKPNDHHGKRKPERSVGREPTRPFPYERHGQDLGYECDMRRAPNFQGSSDLRGSMASVTRSRVVRLLVPPDRLARLI